VKPKWKRFEELVKKVQEDLAPGALVTLDEKIEGKITGVKRQIDISIRQKIGQYEVLIVMDCKDLSKPVDVKDVEEVIGLAEDVGANKGAIVSANGFSKAARTRGEKAGLELYSLIDTGDHDWKTIVTVPYVVIMSKLKSFSLKLTTSGPVILPYDKGPQYYQVYSESGEELGTVIELLYKAWYGKKIPTNHGRHKDIEFIFENIVIRPEKSFYRIKFSVSYSVEESCYFKHVPAEEVSGFKNEVSGDMSTTEILTQEIDSWAIEDTWDHYRSMADVPTAPVIIMNMMK